MSRAAVVLSGCGFLDGSEITEAVSVLIHLSRRGVAVECFAPNKPQADVVDHAAQQPARESRNVMAESARIARGRIRPLGELRAAEFDCVVFPGGYGAAKNLSDFAGKGASCTLDREVERVLKEFHGAGKPIGLCCIAPVLAARALGARAGGPGVVVTIGDDTGCASAIRDMGSSHADRKVDEACWDEKARVGTAPAYMYGEAKPHEVFDGIGKMVEEVLARARAGV